MASPISVPWPSSPRQTEVIYWDHNASTPLCPEVAALMAEHLRGEAFLGNSASLHQAGRAARQKLESSRARIARSLGCDPKALTFTASGAEANALALKGAFLARTQPERRQLLSSQIEHPSVLATLSQLVPLGAELLLLPPAADGQVKAEAFAQVLGPQTFLCSLMGANNETGVLQPTQEVAALCRAQGILVHSDAVQLTGRVPLQLHAEGPDLVSLSGHKFGGPSGVGLLYSKTDVALTPLVPGHQEGGRRGGSASPELAEGFALALELAQAQVAEQQTRWAALRDHFEAQVLSLIPSVQVNGKEALRLPNTSNLRFEGADAETLLIALDLDGICVSMGAACASGSVQPSHALTAMGLSAKEAKECLRFSLGQGSHEEEVSQVVDALKRHVTAARR